MATSERPLAIRATAVFKRSLFGRRRRTFHYEACFADGHVERDVNADELLDGQRFPADAWATRHAAEATCPDVGVGRWVEYATGRQLDDPPAG